MKEKMLKLREAIHNTDNPEEIEKIELQMDELLKQDPDAFAEEMIAYAKEYFKKSDNWIYQRVNGNIVNGKPAAFTPEQIQTDSQGSILNTDFHGAMRPPPYIVYLKVACWLNTNSIV